MVVRYAANHIKKPKCLPLCRSRDADQILHINMGTSHSSASHVRSHHAYQNKIVCCSMLRLRKQLSQSKSKQASSRHCSLTKQGASSEKCLQLAHRCTNDPSFQITLRPIFRSGCGKALMEAMQYMLLQISLSARAAERPSIGSYTKAMVCVRAT